MTTLDPLDPATTIAPALQAELETVGWMYRWRLAPGVTTRLLADSLTSVHQTRMELIEPIARAALEAAGPGATALDLACNEGWFSHKLLEWGAERVVGIDVREHNIRRATLVRDHLGIPAERLTFIRQDGLALAPSTIGRFDVVLLLGLIYHMEQPLEMVRIARRLTRSVCLIESQLIRRNEAVLFTNGMPYAFQPLQASFGAYVEDDEDNALASTDGVMSLVPNRAALELMPRWAGFGDVRFLDAAPHHDPQYVHGDRGIVAAHVRVGRRYDAHGRPLPPLELMYRIGQAPREGEPTDVYQRAGAELKRIVTDALPDSWEWRGKRVLDFGCGAGRVLRQFHDEAQVAELYGCDIDQPSIDWLRENMAPPFRPFAVAEEPGLPFEDEALDLIWAASVFTHLTDHWAGWLLELHRALRPDGLLLASFLNSTMGERFLPLPWDEDRVGMLTIGHGTPWDHGGPAVFHSEWWLRAHWGRAFEVIALDRNDGVAGAHGWVLLRKRRVRGLTVEELERPEPGEPRELEALRHNIEQLGALATRRP